MLTIEQYDDALKNISGGGAYADFAENEEYVNVLLRRLIVEKTGCETLAAKMNESSEFKECMEWLFSDSEMLRYYVYGGEPEANGIKSSYKKANSDTYMKSFDILTQLYTKHKTDLADAQNAPLYKRMMAAIALTHSVTIYSWFHDLPNGLRNKWIHTSDAVGRYELYKKFYNYGFLAKEFEKYNVEELRMVMRAPIDNAQLEWMQHYYRVKFLKNPDYDTRVVQASSANVGGACGMRYSTYSKDPYQPGSADMYNKDKFDIWNEKYMLSVHDGIFDYDVDYGLNEKNQYYEQQWIVIERGGVCTEISFTGCIVRNAFGLASRYLYQAPDHMSYMPYSVTDSGAVICGNGYNVYGIPNSGFMGHGYTHTPGGWSDYSFVNAVNVGYMFLGAEALRNNRNTNYEKAENLIYLAEIKTAAGEYEAAEAIYEEALNAQYFNFGAYVGLADLYQKMNKTDNDYYALANRAAENLKWYPMPMHDYIMRVISPKISSGILRSDLIRLVYDTLTVGMSAGNDSGLYQPNYCREIAAKLRGTLTKVANFSFDTGAITLNKDFRTTGKDFFYSFDGGTTWNKWEYSEGVTSLSLTAEEIAQITDANDIVYKFDTAEKMYIISIGTGQKPVQNATTNILNDDEDKILKLQSGLEYSTDGGTTWNNLTSSCTFEGDVTVLVRKKATGTNLASASITLNFTEPKDPPERRYLKLSENVKLASFPSGLNPAQNALDGNLGTYWENSYPKAYKRDETGTAWIAEDNYEFIFEITEPHYISAIGYVPKVINAGETDGTITGCEIYVSNDNKEWQLAGRADKWAYIKDKNEAYPREQSIDFIEPIYAKYIKIKTTKIGRKEFQGFNVGYATASEFRLYENVTCPEKEISVLKLSTDKTSYKVGDKLDKSSITAQLEYTDGTTSIIPSGELTYNEDIFSAAGEITVLAEYRGVKSSFMVNVAENDRTATAISSAAAADRRYYAGDKFDKADALIMVTDGNESWYLMPDEYTLQNDLLAVGANNITVLHNGITASVSLSAEKTVKGMRIDTDESFKQNYFIGDEASLDGMSVKLIYTDDSEETLTDADYKMEWLDGETPVRDEELTRTAGTKTIRVTLNNKSDINASLDVTVFTYISFGEFAFEAIEGEAACKMTGFIPSGDLRDRTVEIPETITVGGHIYKVTEISDGAFTSAAGLEAVSIPKSVGKIGAGAFSLCTALKKIYMTDYEGFDGFICEEGAFADVQGGYVYLGDGVDVQSSPIPGYEIAGIVQSAAEISVTPPLNTEYVLGDEIDKTGMVVTVVLSDGGSAPVHSYSISGYDPYTIGEQTVTITLDGSNLSDTFTVSVGFPEITIDKSPKGAVYTLSDTIEPLSVTASTKNDNTVFYRWYRSETPEKNGTVIEGASSAQYTPTQEGYYYAAVYVKDKNGKVSEEVYSDIARIMVGDFEAAIGATGYETFVEAAVAADDKSVISLLKDIEISDTAQITGVKKVAIDGRGYTIRRGNGFEKAFILLKDGADATLKNITLDGGAVWSGDADTVTKHGLTNSGLRAICPLILAYDDTELTLSEGSVLQNNYNAGGSADDKSTDNSNITGGAVWTRSATLNLDGCIIRDNASDVFGSAIYLRGTSVLTSYDVEISGNYDSTPQNDFNASAICTDNDTTVNIQDGRFINNRGSKQGGVFWIGNGTIMIKDGLFENNYTSGDGGVGYFYQSGSKSTLTINGGVFKNNRADGSAGAFYCHKAASVANAVFENNSAAADGGALWASNAALSVTDSTFSNNKANNGGAIWSGNNVSMTGGSFDGNTAAQKGNAVYIGNNKQLNFANVSDFGEEQDIFENQFKVVNITGLSNDGKILRLTTATDIAADTLIANAPYKHAMDVRVNGIKTVYVQENNKWVLKTAATSTVKYNKDGGIIDGEYAYTAYVNGEGLTLPTPEREGYIFAGWFDNQELSGTAVTEIGADETENKEYWAKWTICSYSIRFENYNGELLKEINAEYNTMPKYDGDEPIKEQDNKYKYEFIGWEPLITVAKADAIYTAQFEAIPRTYSVTLNSDGGVFDNAGKYTAYTYGGGFKLPTPERYGHIFEGWYDNANFSGEPITEITPGDSGDKKYWAKWTKAEYRVTLHTNEGTLSEHLTGYIHGAAVPLPIPEREGYVFDGWFDNQELSGTAVIEIGADETGNKEYWAKWTVCNYAIRFENYNGELLKEISAEYNTMPKYDGDEPIREQDDEYTYKFIGWEPLITAAKADATYTAQFEVIPRTYSVTLNSDGGVFDDVDKYTAYTYGEGMILPMHMVKDGFYFIGWYDNPNFEGEPISAIEAEAIGDKEYWAKWDENPPTEYTVTFLNYDNHVLQSDFVKVGEIPSYDGIPERPSDERYLYTFTGWDRELMPVTEIAEYKAQYEKTPIVYLVECTDDGVLVLSPEAGEYTVIFAAYNDDDTFAGVETAEITFEAAGEQIVTPNQPELLRNKRVKIMLWNNFDSITPKCEYAEKLFE